MQPYLVAPAADPSDSREAAAATAAHEVLGGTQGARGRADAAAAGSRLARPALYAVAGGGPGRVGQDGGDRDRRGRRLSDARRAGRRRTLRHVPVRGGLRSWRVAASAAAGTHGDRRQGPGAWVGDVTPFLVPNVEMLRSDGPNALTSAAYAEEFKEVKKLGSLTSTKRTADQTAAAAVLAETATIWNGVLRCARRRAKDLDIADSARLLAEDEPGRGRRLDWLLERQEPTGAFGGRSPRSGRPESDGNAATEADPGWLPLFNATIPVSGAPLVTPASGTTVGARLHQRRHRAHAEGLLRDRQDRVRRR